MMNMGERMGGHHACAPCKHQRRKCQPDCFLAPYFPATRWQDFVNVHKLFGVSNVVKMLNSVEPQDRAFVAETLIMEAKAWKDNPANGCLGITRQLYSQLEALKNELAAVREQIAYFREQQNMNKVQLTLGPLQQQVLQAAAASSSPTSPLMQQLGISFSNPQPPTLLDFVNEGSNYFGEAMNLSDFGSSSSQPKSEPLQVDEEYEDVKPIITPVLANQKNKAIVESKDSEESSVESGVDAKGKEKVLSSS